MFSKGEEHATIFPAAGVQFSIAINLERRKIIFELNHL